MGKKVWLVSHYAMPPQYELRWKTLKYAEYLQKAGYEVLLVTASTIHNTDVNLIEGKEKFVEKQYGDLRFVHIKCGNYRGSGIKRILNMRQFSHRFKKVMKRFEKPDIIVCDCNCVNYRPILDFARKFQIKFVCEIRDLWPLSIVEYLGISAKNPIIRYLYGQEKRMYRLSNGILFSIPGGKDYIKDKGWENVIDFNKIYYINNGVEISELELQREEFRRSDSDLDNQSFKVIYAGSIRTANSVEKIISAAEIIAADKSADIQFLLYGKGDDRERLEAYCAERGLSNVVFKGQVKKEWMPYILSKCNIGLLTYKNVGTWKYGGSQNKVFDYMAAGLPIISNIKMGHSLLTQYRCGIELEQDTPQAMANAITEVYRLPIETYEQMRDNAFAAARDFDYKTLTDRLIDLIEDVTEKRA